jgi:hypothetical protein
VKRISEYVCSPIEQKFTSSIRDLSEIVNVSQSRENLVQALLCSNGLMN